MWHFFHLRLPVLRACATNAANIACYFPSPQFSESKHFAYVRVFCNPSTPSKYRQGSILYLVYRSDVHRNWRKASLWMSTWPSLPSKKLSSTMDFECINRPNKVVKSKRINEWKYHYRPLGLYFTGIFLDKMAKEWKWWIWTEKGISYEWDTKSIRNPFRLILHTYESFASILNWGSIQDKMDIKKGAVTSSKK